MSSKIANLVEENVQTSKSRFVLLIVGVVIISFVLVYVSMWLYSSSGAAQLDLSRPGYQSVRSQSIDSDNVYQTYSSVGDINQSTIDEFQGIYNEQANRIKTVDAFSGNPLSPESMGFSENTTK
jgi:flagellar basal body-associated protein FliL